MNFLIALEIFWNGGARDVINLEFPKTIGIELEASELFENTIVPPAQAACQHSQQLHVIALHFKVVFHALGTRERW